ncbi:hypothetical protein XU18_2550 [Perkinsela sp. CCAP 1560/4]|nr:CTD small phosphatase-like protein-like protein [Perkinsela sp. CCAP 1560/4]KNH06649.1 hypothetical protein XU18_2550 [Perkinsela sp. CCAP 1560/4]|eukprot:KNH04644.1 CTD small phosphatase-like protein-like protein [Perkinsela sp. CCAP 1560/4]
MHHGRLLRHTTGNHGSRRFSFSRLYSYIFPGFPYGIQAFVLNTQKKLKLEHQRFLVTCGSTVSLLFGVSYMLLSRETSGIMEYDQVSKLIPRYTDSGKQILIPDQKMKKKGWKTLVLDMDEMLVGNATGMTSNSMKLVPFSDGSFSHIHRPYLKEFLQYAAANFEVVLWTAGTKRYAEECIRNILSVHSLPLSTFDFVVARDPSWFEITPTSWYMKDLHQLGRSIEHVLMLENAPVVRPSSNAIIVSDYHHSRVRDTHAGSREFQGNGRLSPQKILNEILTGFPKKTVGHPPSSATVVPCSSLHPNDDATLLTSMEIIKRWKSSSKKVHEFLQEEMERGVLFRAHIQPYKSRQSEAMATLPLHRLVG